MAKFNLEDVKYKVETKVEKESEKGKEESYTAVFENEDKGIKIVISSPTPINLIRGENYTFTAVTEQQKLTIRNSNSTPTFTPKIA
jgi:hypothetical protein